MRATRVCRSRAKFEYLTDLKIGKFKGGQPRYDPDNDRELWNELIKQDKLKLKDYITSTYFS